MIGFAGDISYRDIIVYMEMQYILNRFEETL